MASCHHPENSRSVWARKSGKTLLACSASNVPCDPLWKETHDRLLSAVCTPRESYCARATSLFSNQNYLDYTPLTGYHCPHSAPVLAFLCFASAPLLVHRTLSSPTKFWKFRGAFYGTRRCERAHSRKAIWGRDLLVRKNPCVEANLPISANGLLHALPARGNKRYRFSFRHNASRTHANSSRFTR